MKMSGERRINASREDVWTALNDPDVLKKCIDGCKELTKSDENSFTARVQASVGPVKANFTGEVTLSDINAPESYRISGQGKGGAAGFAKGGAEVALAEDGNATVLTYNVDAKVGGKLAQIGNRLIDSTAKKMADDFFDKFSAEVEGGAERDEEEADTSGVTPPPVNDNREVESVTHSATKENSPIEQPTSETLLAASSPVDAKSRSGRVILWIGAILIVLAGLYFVRY